MSTLGGLFTNSAGSNTATLDRLNAKTMLEGSGAQIAAIGFASIGKGTIAYCSSTGSGFTEGVYYGLNSAKTAWISIGGLFREYLAGGITDTLYASMPVCNVNNFITETGSGGSAATNTGGGGVDLITGTTTNGYGNAAVEGITMTFASNAKVLLKVDFDASNPIQIRVRAGVSMERVDAAAGVLRKFGIEVDVTTVAANWSVVSADGTTRSTTLSGAGQSSSSREYKLEFLTGASVKYYSSGTLDTTKTTNIPSSTTTGSERLFGVGAMTKNTTSKTFNLRGFELVGKKGDVF